MVRGIGQGYEEMGKEEMGIVKQGEVERSWTKKGEHVTRYDFPVNKNRHFWRGMSK